MNKPTTEQNLATVLDNGFRVNRNVTKNAKVFKSNTLTRPMCATTFFQILNACTDRQTMTTMDCYRWMHNKFATDYINNWDASIHLVVNLNTAYIQSELEWLDVIYLDIPKLREHLRFLNDDALYTTDFGRSMTSERYYHKAI